MKVKMDENQYELVPTTGEIVPAQTRELNYLSEAQIAQRSAAGKASVAAFYENTNRVDYISKCAAIGARSRENRCFENYLAAFHEYLEMSASEGQKIGNLTAYLAIGVDHKTFEQWGRGDLHKDDPRFKQFYRYVKTICAAHREQMALNGTVHPALSIFWQKNFDGLNDEGVLRIEASDPFAEKKDTEEIRRKYQDLAEE